MCANEIKFSIVVPIYKVEKYIRQCIDSILAQTYSNLELILVDDGSPDNCPAILDEYATKDNRIFVIHKENGGLVSAWKAGVRQAKNGFLLFVDGDDWLDVNLLHHLEKLLETNRVDLIQFGFKKKQDTEQGDDNFRIIETKDILDKLIYYKGYRSFIYNSRCNKVFLTDKIRSLLADIDESVNIGEDKQTTLCYILNSKNILLSEYEGYYCRQNIDSMTRSYSPEMYDKTEALFENMTRLTKKYSDFDFSKQLMKSKAVFAITMMTNVFRCKSREIRRIEFNKIVNNAEIASGVNMISDADFNFFHKKIISGIRTKNYRKISFWQTVRHIKGMMDMIKYRICHKSID